MNVSLLSSLTVAALAITLSSCAPTGSKFTKLGAAKYPTVAKKGAGSPKAVVIARQRKATPAQVQVAVTRITNYIDSLSDADRAVVKKARYVCVCTTQAPDSQGKVTCMAWDTQSQSFVGNNTYELVNPPPVPSTLQFDSFNAIFVGTASIGPS